MGLIVHARQRPEGMRFRLWSTIADGYCCEPMAREAFAVWMRERADADAVREIEERLVRAETTGTSAFGEAADEKAEWDTERCERCGGFHHAYVLGPGAACAQCGNPRRSVSHGKPCK